jgi:hypothetical protein
MTTSAPAPRWTVLSVLVISMSLVIAGAQSPLAIPTFHSLGLYWSPTGGATNRQVTVRFRQEGAKTWNEGLPLRYNPIPNTEEDLTDYRGSIVHLRPGTAYEIELSLQGTSLKTNLIAKTWSERFPIGQIVRMTNQNSTVSVTESGTPHAWRLYDGRGATIDVQHEHDECIIVNASNVILRGFTLRGAGSKTNTNRRPIGAIRIDSGEDIVIEDCDISGWGRLNAETGFGFDYDAAIFSRSARVKRLVIQRCKLHDPQHDGSNWHEPTFPTHSMGPQCISLFDTGGNHVIRHNECWSDMEHMFNDIIGGGSNGSYRGSPGHDSDIYGNYVSHCWDDGLEVEGGNRNVRVWGNYITQTMISIGNAATSIGPLYIWRNVGSRFQARPNAPGLHFLKMGFAGSEDWMTGHQYIFHNTIYASDEWLPSGGLGGDRIVKHTMSRNNILHVRSPGGFSQSRNRRNADNSFNYDLYNGQAPQGEETHGIQGEPQYEKGSGFDFKKMTGSFRLEPTSPGANAGEHIPNFSPFQVGEKPDAGAHQRGTEPMRYGVIAAE